jgi:hypothetical protein
MNDKCHHLEEENTDLSGKKIKLDQVAPSKHERDFTWQLVLIRQPMLFQFFPNLCIHKHDQPLHCCRWQLQCSLRVHGNWSSTLFTEVCERPLTVSHWGRQNIWRRWWLGQNESTKNIPNSARHYLFQGPIKEKNWIIQMLEWANFCSHGKIFLNQP